jgi:hypothetical protein
MKRIILIGILGLFAIGANAQAERYLNFGGLGTGLYASLEFPVANNISVAPQVATDWDLDYLVISAKGNYYFDELFGIGSDWDVYGGANVGFLVGDDDGLYLGLQVGGRWFWSDRWGLNAEFGGGTGVLGGLGVTVKL